MDDLDDIDRLEELLAAEEYSDGEIEPPKQVAPHVYITEDTSFLKETKEIDDNLLAGKENFKKKIKRNKGFLDSSFNLDESSVKKISSVIHSGDTDSSDDEEKKCFSERKYSDYSDNYNNKLSSFKSKLPNISKVPMTKGKEKLDVYSDPIFKIRMINPLISGAQLEERMLGREVISMNRLKRHITAGDKCTDWVIAGVIVRKSSTQESKKGAQYCIWTLSDLKDDLKTVAVFLFRNAHKELWKTNQGMVVGVLNPSVLDNKDGSGDEACLSVDNPDRVMLIGTSKDFGFCKSTKNNGDPCTSFVNIHQCEYCIYHVKQQYKKCSNSRAELQSRIGGGRGLMELQNKLLGKNTVIYGGKAYSSIPATKSLKQTLKDTKRMQSLSEYFQPTTCKNVVSKSTVSAPIKKNARRVEASVSQRLKDLKRLEFLQVGTSKSQSVLKIENKLEWPKSNNEPSTSKSLMSPTKTKPGQTAATGNTKLNNIHVPSLGIPMLGFGLKKSSMVDLSIPITQKHTDRAKTNALKWIKQNGPLKKNDPHNLKGTKEGKKRNIDILNISTESSDGGEVDRTPKKPKIGINSERFQKMLAATSVHTDLIEQHDDSEVDKYFNKLESKEKLEEKMLNTYKVACKAVRCLKCLYTSFSAAERCKQEKHPLKVFDAMKRFFKCSRCSNRIVSLDIIPTQACKNCQNTSWQRAGMIAEKKVLTTASKLSITGGEEFLGHVEHGADINLLVPEEFQ